MSWERNINIILKFFSDKLVKFLRQKDQKQNDFYTFQVRFLLVLEPSLTKAIII